MTLSTLSDICGILGFILSLFAIGGVIKINKKISTNNSNSKNQNARGSGNTQTIN